jgi:hypothetical protein
VRPAIEPPTMITLKLVVGWDVGDGEGEGSILPAASSLFLSLFLEVGTILRERLDCVCLPGDCRERIARCWSGNLVHTLTINRILLCLPLETRPVFPAGVKSVLQRSSLLRINKRIPTSSLYGIHRILHSQPAFALSGMLQKWNRGCMDLASPTGLSSAG